jgi:hypothetical protein
LSEKAPDRVLFCGLRQTFVTLQIDFTLVCLVFRLPIISIRKINRGVNWIKLNRFTGLALKGNRGIMVGGKARRKSRIFTQS